MPAAPIPPNEDERLAELQSLDLLDTLPEQSYDDLTHLAAQIADTPIALVSLVDEGRQWFKSNVGLGASETPRDIAFCSHAILDPTHMTIVPDASNDPRFSANPLVTGDPDIRFYAGTPLVTSKGHALGTLCVIDREPRHLDDQQRQSLEAIGRQIVQLIELRRNIIALEAAKKLRAHHERRLAAYREQLEDHLAVLAEQSLRDSLTGLYNRSALDDRLTAELAAHRRSGRPVAVAMIDIDHFKLRNDTYGHAAGDEALRALARVLQETCREADTAARYGGEEFTVVLSDTGPGGAAFVADRIRRAVAALDLEGSGMTVSLGVAIADADHQDPESILAAADAALYEAKEGGRDRVVVAANAEPTTTVILG